MSSSPVPKHSFRQYRSLSTLLALLYSQYVVQKIGGIACNSFTITNIDDMFVLVTFFSKASTSKTVTPLRISLGQYIGFTVIIIISIVSFGASIALPSEPIGFLGLLPMLMGVWKFFVFSSRNKRKNLLEYQVLDTLIFHNILSEVELIDLSNLMSDYSFLICTQSVPNIDSQSLY
jgi:cadmium resistance protein CadD (predicted permease)